MDAFGEPWINPAMIWLIIFEVETVRRRPAPSSRPCGHGLDHRPGLLEIGLGSADHDRQYAILGAGLAARNRRIEKPSGVLLGQLACDKCGRAVVLSMKTAPSSWTEEGAVSPR